VIIVPAESASEQVVQIIERLVPRHGEPAAHLGVSDKLGGDEILGDRDRG
jgi:hypothetical protein